MTQPPAEHGFSIVFFVLPEYGAKLYRKCAKTLSLITFSHKQATMQKKTIDRHHQPRRIIKDIFTAEAQRKTTPF
ncbi:MAG: hypothetical protein DRQ44_02350 [Gammaproteobacteria bacterium]|nr:MAG: hypothetical protein DRQ44_02350 [Gammaproteobacteria bacterium]